MFQIDWENLDKSIPTGRVQGIARRFGPCESIGIGISPVCELVQNTLVAVVLGPHKAQMLKSVRCSRIIIDFSSEGEQTLDHRAFMIDYHHPQTGPSRFILCYGCI